MPPVFCVTGPFGQVVFGQPWSLPVGPGFEVPDPRKFAGTLQATPNDYGSLLISWGLPTGTDIDRFAVVRAGFGSPPSRYTGVTVMEGDPAAPLRSTVDSGLFPGEWFYYSLFVRDTASGQWVLAAKASALSIKDWGYHDTLWRALPLIYRTMDRQLVSSTEEGALYRFLKIFAFEFDVLRSLAGNIEQARNIERVGSVMLPAFSADLGTPYETVLGDAKMRGILNSIIHWRKDKGTEETLEDLAQTISSCADAHVELVPNLLLDHNDSGWDEPTLGRWFEDTDVSLARSTSTPAPRSSTGYLSATAEVGGDMVLASADPASIKTQGIKVEPGQIYCASIYTRSDGVDRSVAVDIEWYDRNGAPAVSDSPTNTDPWGPYGQVPHGQVNWQGPHGPAPYGSGEAAGTPNIVSELAAVNNDTDWETRVHMARTAPSNARFARMTVTVEDPLVGEVHHFDEAQFEMASSPSDWEPARKVLVFACGARTNKIINPTFEVGGLGWSTINSALTIDATEGRFGAKSLLLEPLGPGVSAAATVVDVDPSKFYTFSIHAKPLDDDVPIIMTMEWLDDDGNVLRTFGREDTLAPGGWRRPWVTDVGPEGATQAMVSIVAYLNSGEQMRIDAALMEAGDVVQDYFDGSFAGVDYSWTGVAHASPSILIVNRDLYENVLGRYLDEYVPASTPWEIVYTA